MAEITVRQARIEDALAMARVHVISWQETYRGQVSDDILDDPAALTRRQQQWQTTLEASVDSGRSVAVAE